MLDDIAEVHGVSVLPSTSRLQGTGSGARAHMVGKEFSCSTDGDGPVLDTDASPPTPIPTIDGDDAHHLESDSLTSWSDMLMSQRGH